MTTGRVYKKVIERERNLEYKGVCRLDYLSVDLLYEILAIGTMLTRNLGL